MNNLPKAIICDLDGTLCLFKHHRGPYDASKCLDDLPNKAVVSIVERFALTHWIIFVSGRQETWFLETCDWINKHIVFPSTVPSEKEILIMRKEGDNRKDSIVKQEIYDQFIKDKYDIEFVLDDRDQVVEMWRANGLTCLQVAEGSF
jgi:hypothetical protein